MKNTHHFLTKRSDLQHLGAWDANLCAMNAEAFGTPSGVMKCLQPFDAQLTGAKFLAAKLLPMRAIAEARLKNVAGAEADLARLRALKASEPSGSAAFVRLPEVEAEILMAKGQDKAAFDGLRQADHDAGTDPWRYVAKGIFCGNDGLRR